MKKDISKIKANKLKLNSHYINKFDKKIALSTEQNEFMKFKTVKTEIKRPKLIINNNEELKNKINPNLGIRPKSFRSLIKSGEKRKIQDINKTLNKKSDRIYNNYFSFKPERKASSHQKYIDPENFWKKEPMIVLKKKYLI